MKALIKVGYACNDNCVFCHASAERELRDTGERIEAKIRRAAALGHTMVVLSGGEPTIRPELLGFAREAKRRGLSFGLVTNGRALASADLVDRLVEHGLTYAYVSLHGGRAEVHDAIVRVEGAFLQTSAGLRNLARAPLDLTINCVVARPNLHHLNEWVEHALTMDGAKLKLSMIEPKGAAAGAFDDLVPEISAAADAAGRAIRHGESLDPGKRILHDGFPSCLLPGLEDRTDDLWSHGFASMSEAWEDDFFPVDDDNRLEPESCGDCSLTGSCPGLFAAYHERRGKAPLSPRLAPRSNSFNLVPVATGAWRRGRPCPVKGNTTHHDRSRTLFLRNGERLTLFSTRTRDFSTAELRDVKYRFGQIYVDASEKAAPDDFSADLLKARMLELCVRCEDEQRCPGCFGVLREDVFGRDDALLSEQLARLRGQVLDIGCGRMPQAGVLEPLAREGLISYRGVDPDEACVQDQRRSHGWASLEVCAAEDLRLEPDCLDHVLLLRSYNHLRDPALVLSRAARALRPGGSIIIADNVAFGLIRRPDHARAAEGGAAAMEHYRNHSSSAAALALEKSGLGLRSVLEREVSASTSNQWLLILQRPPG